MGLKNRHPAEIARGLIFQELFSSAANIASNGGVITGALEYRDKGAVFDGTNDYVTYPANTAAFKDATFFSAVIEFTPTFAYDANAEKDFFACTTGHQYTLYKTNNADNNTLVLYLGNTYLGEVASAAYSAYWKVNQRNVIVIAGTTAATKVYLNGTQVGSFNTAWTPSVGVATLYVGANNGGAGKFSGTIHSLKIFGSKVSALTAQEASDYHTGQTFNYMKRASCILPMTADCHDATNLRTLDVSGKGNHATLPAAYIKRATRGYDVVSPNLFQIATALATGAYSLCIAFKNNIQAGDRELFSNVSDTKYVLRSGATDVISTSSLGTPTIYSKGVASNKNYINELSIVCVSGFTLTVSEIYNIFKYLNGSIFYFALYPFALTPLQIIDATLKLKQQINQV